MTLVRKTIHELPLNEKGSTLIKFYNQTTDLPEGTLNVVYSKCEYCQMPRFSEMYFHEKDKYKHEIQARKEDERCSYCLEKKEKENANREFAEKLREFTENYRGKFSQLHISFNEGPAITVIGGRNLV